MACGRVSTSDADGDFAHRVSLERHRRSLAFPMSPLSLIDSLSGKSVSVSYDKLPVEPLKLSILKLDGSSFDVEVLKTATVDELKRAVEAVFSHLPQKGPGKISWPHVWGRFCLSYNDQKLLVDTDYVRDYGVKDGDQLHFVRHVSISYNMVKKRSKKVFVDSKHKHMSQSPSINCSDEEQNDRKIYKCNDKGKGKLHHIADQGCFRGHHEIRVTQLLGEWFSHCKIASLGKKRVEDLACPSRVTTGFWGGFKKIIQRCGIGGKCYSRRATILLSNGRVRRHP